METVRCEKLIFHQGAGSGFTLNLYIVEQLFYDPIVKEGIQPMVAERRVAFVAGKLRNFRKTFRSGFKCNLLSALSIAVINIAIFNRFQDIIHSGNFEGHCKVLYSAKYAQVEE